MLASLEVREDAVLYFGERETILPILLRNTDERLIQIYRMEFTFLDREKLESLVDGK